MTLNRVLALTSIALGVALVIQAALVISRPPVRQLHVSWIDLANTLEEAIDQSDHIIVGEVLALRKGQDIVVRARGEPNDEDRVPTQIVKLRVEKALMGAPGEVIELFQTGQSTDAEVIPPVPDVLDQLIQDLTTRGREQPLPEEAPTAGEERGTILEDDPAYQVGERYVLFLKDMRDLKRVQAPEGRFQITEGDNLKDMRDSPTQMKRVLAPEGRFQITKGDKLKPVTLRRGFAPQWFGRELAGLEQAIQKFVRPIR